MPGTPRYRGLRRTANRAALLGAAEELFGTKGFAATSVDDLVARAGVAKGTFYNHFSDKRDLAAALAVSIRHGVRDRIAEAKLISADPAEHLAIAVSHFLCLALDHPHRAMILVTLLAGATEPGADFNRPMRNTLEAGQAEGRFRIANIETAVIAQLGIVSAAIRSLVEHRPADPRTRLVEFVVHCLAAAGINPPGEERALAARAVDRVLAAV